jgi:hypothetical protein
MPWDGYVIGALMEKASSNCKIYYGNTPLVFLALWAVIYYDSSHASGFQYISICVFYSSLALLSLLSKFAIASRIVVYINCST